MESLPESTIPYYPELPPEPTQEQVERREARRRYERNTLFVPVGIVAFLWIVVILAMLWLSLAGEWFGVDTNQTEMRSLFNGVANVVVILTICFWMLMLMIPMSLIGYVWSYRRKQIAARPPGPKPLPFFWRIENVIIRIRDIVADFLPKLAHPVILVYGIAAYIKTLFNEIKKLLGVGNAD